MWSDTGEDAMVDTDEMIRRFLIRGGWIRVCCTSESTLGGVGLST